MSFFAVRRRCGCWQIVWGAKDFCPNFAQLARKELNTNISSKKRLHFAWICTKSKVLGVRLHPRLLLQWIYGYISVGYPDKRVTLLMRFTLFNALQIFKLTMKLNISSPFLCEQKGHSVHGTLCYDSAIDALCFIRNALPKHWMLKMHGFRRICRAGLNHIWPVASRSPHYPYKPTQTFCLCSAGARVYSAWDALQTKIEVNCAVFNAPTIFRFCSVIVTMFIVFRWCVTCVF